MQHTEVIDTSTSLVQPAKALAVDTAKLAQYLANNIAGYPQGVSVKFELLQFAHGQSNPTYLVQIGQQRYVLRKKPPGKLLPSAHAVDREYRVLHALGTLKDPSVLGTPFYLMQFLPGRIFIDPNCPSLTPTARMAVYTTMARTLAALHSVRPSSVGLEGFGKPQHYCARQVKRWDMQYRSQLDAEPPLTEMTSLAAWLREHVPVGDADASTACIAHGDYRLDNLVYDPTTPSHILGILDWELATLGHPLADLAYSCMPYVLSGGNGTSTVTGIPVLQNPLPPGIPTMAEYVGMYCKARGVEVPTRQELVYFLALSLFRIAAILAGVGARARMGNASSRAAAQVGSTSSVRALAAAALRLVDQATRHVDHGQYAVNDPLHGLPSTVNSHNGQHNVLLSGGVGVHASTASGGVGVHASTGSGITGFEPTPRVQQLLTKLKAFMKEHIFPHERAFNAHATSPHRWTIPPLIDTLKVKAQQLGLWNLWIPPSLVSSIHAVLGAADPGLVASLDLGPGLSNVEYAFLSEQMGRVWWASEVFNCGAPDTGNMEVLAKYGNASQQRTWLVPLLQGTIRSCFAMTEPAVASSDATNITCSIQHNPTTKQYIINGHKWWISGAMDPRCAIAIVMGKTDTTAPTHAQQSMVLVPMNTPGVEVVRPLQVFGYDDAPHGHAEVRFTDVRVPDANIILGPGRGFEIAQGRLGPGRLHHCMRSIGMGSRALEIMATRAASRRAFGRPLTQQGAFLKEFAQSHIKLQAARLVVLQAAHALDLHGNKAARGQIAAAKVLAPTTVLEVIDAAVQVCGAAGVGEDLPLAQLWAQARTLRIADGPDDVHLASFAKLQLRALASKL